MATLRTSNEFLGKRQLAFSIKLLKTESFGVVEDDVPTWIYYEAEILNGDDTVSIATDGPTITTGDVQGLYEILKDLKHKSQEIIPLEPDFVFEASMESPDEVYVSIFIDEGIRRHDGYTSSGIGVRLCVTHDDVTRFAKELETELANVTAENS